MDRAELTYAEVGATSGGLPAGYRHVEEERAIGVGRDFFAAAGARLLRWEMQTGAGLVVEGRPEVRVGDDAVVIISMGPLRLRAPVRILAVVDEPTRIGFTYGTLPGHPESGEELFSVELRPDDTVWARVRAFSRPGRWFTRLGDPVAVRVQRRVTQRYLTALAG